MWSMSTTEYAIANGADVDIDGYCNWWLRSPSPFGMKLYIDTRFIDFIDSSDQSIVSSYVYCVSNLISNKLVSSRDVVVRPALWIKL